MPLVNYNSQQNVAANDFNYPEVDELFRLMTK